jgi:FkbM family methyltransferase
MKSLIKSLLRGLGYDLVKIPYPGSHGRKLQEVFERFDINLVCDVGARHGEYAGEVRESGYRGWIASFEPVSTNFKAISERHGNDPKWQGFNMALGAAQAEMEINVTAGSAMSSFREPNAYAKEQFVKDSVIERTEKVQVNTLEGIMPELKALVPEPRIYLKLDTQGFDLEVLKGAQPVLAEVAALQSEISVKAIYENMPSYTEALLAYEAHGFELAGLFPVKEDDGGAVIEFDCVMIRRDAERSR